MCKTCVSPSPLLISSQILTTTSLIVDARIPEPARRLEQLVQRILKSNRLQAARAIQDGCVQVNRRTVVRPQTVVEVGSLVAVDVQPLVQPQKLQAPRRESIQVIFEDESVLVVRKPAGLLTVPTPHRERHTVISEVNQHLSQAQKDAIGFCVHRLDRGVSGLLVFAKSLEIAELLRNQFAARKPKRRYIAFVAGQLREPAGTVKSYLATDSSLNQYSTDEESGQLAITHYKTLRQWRDIAQVEVKLETGRRNQIRVHFSEMGHPVLGDERYGKLDGMHRFWPFKRIALHAETLAFEHPKTQQPMEFTSALPGEFHQLLKKLGSDASGR
jgi:23S rRNA pseudouridine1911/1915/1917 synthase